ncbi:MAG: response regulator [Acidobacteria bacterium]|nr:response regulator [Acidobacteriota bacterium]
MSLLGRLEDLSIPDIVQIVFLSRRTGMLEIIDGDQRWCIYFRQGRIVAAAAPEAGNLGTYLRQRGLASPDILSKLDSGTPAGDLIDAELISPEQLGEAAKLMIAEVVGSLREKARGEFNFILSETVDDRIDYDPDAIFAEGGISPAEVFESDEKLRPLQGLEESLRAGKALLRGETTAEKARGIGFGEEIRTLTSPGSTAVPETAGRSFAQEEPAFESADRDEPAFEDLGEDAFVDALPETFTGNVPIPEIPGYRAPVFEAVPEVEPEIEPEQEPEPEIEPEQEPEPEIEPEQEPEPEIEPEQEPEPEIEPEQEPEPEIEPGREPEPEIEQPPPFETVSPEPQAELDLEDADLEEVAAADTLESEGVPPIDQVQLALDHAGATGALPPSFESFQRPSPAVAEVDRNVVLFETNPMIRVAAKRTFAEAGYNLSQYGVIEDAAARIGQLLTANEFFVTFLDDSPEVGNASVELLKMIKKKNRHLPVVIVDPEADLERRHEVLEKGAELYLTKPSQAHLRPNIAMTSLNRFGDEMLLFCRKAIEDWSELALTLSDDDKRVGAAFYEIAERERSGRSRNLVKHLIDELSNPDDITTVADTILRLASGWLDRGVLFVASPVRFIGLGGFGETGTGRPMFDLARRLWIPRDEDSVLRDVATTGRSHRGKMRRTPTNVKLVEGMGNRVPSEVIVIPIADGGEVAGILYGDNGGQRMPMGDMNGLEFFIEQAGLAFHNAVLANARKKGIDWNE